MSTIVQMILRPAVAPSFTPGTLVQIRASFAKNGVFGTVEPINPMRKLVYLPAHTPALVICTAYHEETNNKEFVYVLFTSENKHEARAWVYAGTLEAV